MNRKSDPADVKDNQWELIKPLLPPAQSTTSKRNSQEFEVLPRCWVVKRTFAGLGKQDV